VAGVEGERPRPQRPIRVVEHGLAVLHDQVADRERSREPDARPVARVGIDRPAGVGQHRPHAPAGRLDRAEMGPGLDIVGIDPCSRCGR
jgi:hypothetical protein